VQCALSVSMLFLLQHQIMTVQFMLLDIFSSYITQRIPNSTILLHTCLWFFYAILANDLPHYQPFSPNLNFMNMLFTKEGHQVL
jgi:hypothetical protein